MKLLPVVVTISCAAMLVSCGQKAAPDTQAQQDQQQAIEQHQAQEERELHEREAALDEQQRLLDQEKQQLAATTPVQTSPPAEVEQPPVPAPQTNAPPQPANDAPSTDASYQTFYDELAPYGAWIQVPGYGYVWQPLEAQQNPLWRPYWEGHWAFTNEGWTWISDEPFGWITYHYGRWMRTQNLRWAWVPGNQWAPAWVSWRFGNDYVGWAPLPPEAQFNGTPIGQWADQQYGLGPEDYTFVPAANFGDDEMGPYMVPPADAPPIYADSNNITNIYYDTGTQAIICYGPNYDYMRSRSRRPLSPQLNIQRMGFRPNLGNKAVISANTLEVAAPRINRSPSAPKSIRGIVTDRRIIAAATPAPGVAQIVPIPPAPQAASAAIVNERPNAAANQPAAQEQPQQLQQQQRQQDLQEDRPRQQQQLQLQEQANTVQVRQEQERQEAIIERAREQQEQQAAAMRQQAAMARAAQVQAARAQESAMRQNQSGGQPAASPGR